jgi:alpha-glucosidase
MTETAHDPWWRTAVIYEIYPRSFQDSNGDGEGDLRGIIDRLSYVAELGVDAIWLAPWYPSPLADGGYDISDYRDIHPIFGTLEDAEELLDEAHRLGLKVIIDLVANHTSQDHPWFRAALEAGPGSSERQRYLFRDGRGAAGEHPPNNWISGFGTGAWDRVVEPDGSPGQWYHHTFATEQPDLDWRNEDVRTEFDDILRFWLDRGVDGFRIDAVPAIGKDPGLPDADYGDELRFASADWIDNPHWDGDLVHDVIRRWRTVLDAYPGERVFVAEAVVRGPHRLARYLRPDEVHTAFNFDYLHADWNAKELRGVIDETLAALAPVGAPATWVLSSHDEIRHLTRLGASDHRGPTAAGPSLGVARARAAVLLTLALPGSTYLYQGEELGLPEVLDLPDSVRQDPVFFRSADGNPGRDGCRVPVPWSGDRPPFGFAEEGVVPWLPQPLSWAGLTVAVQETDEESMLHLYRAALALRRELTDLHTQPLTWLPSPEGVLHFARGPRLRCVTNLDAEPVELDGTPLISSVAPGLEDRLLPRDSTAWIVIE